MRNATALKMVNKPLPLTKTGKVKDEYPEETGIAFPVHDRKKKYDFGFENISKVGNSKFIPLQEGQNSKAHEQLIRRYMKQTTEKFGGERAFKMAAIKNDDGSIEGFRVWRVEP